VRPPSPADFSNEATKRREIIEKISIRSNLQNPIKKWNLISNDDYQHSLARYFRKNKLYYERRDGEWAQRRTELKSVGIYRGPRIKELMQLIASYHWDKKYLGPVAAKGGRGGLFEEKPYESIRKTPPELVYQICLLSETIDHSLRELAASKRYVDELATYLRLALFSLSVKALQASGAKFGEKEVTAALENKATPGNRWRTFCKSGIDIIRAAYRDEAKRYRKKEGKELTVANFYGRIGSLPKNCSPEEMCFLPSPRYQTLGSSSSIFAFFTASKIVCPNGCNSPSVGNCCTKPFSDSNCGRYFLSPTSKRRLSLNSSGE
jgi:hypothetical protein